MKQIQPVFVWSNGKQEKATILNASVQYDNLVDSAEFTYLIGTPNDEPANLSKPLATGILTMTGQAYVEYQTNQYAWDWIAAQLNLTIIGEYTTTTTTTTAIPAPTTEETTTVI